MKTKIERGYEYIDGQFLSPHTRAMCFCDYDVDLAWRNLEIVANRIHDLRVNKRYKSKRCRVGGHVASTWNTGFAIVGDELVPLVRVGDMIVIRFQHGVKTSRLPLVKRYALFLRRVFMRLGVV